MPTFSEARRTSALARPIARAGRRGNYFEMTPETMFEMLLPD
jgi:hypothetical protein